MRLPNLIVFSACLYEVVYTDIVQVNSENLLVQLSYPFRHEKQKV